MSSEELCQPGILEALGRAQRIDLESHASYCTE